MECSLFEVDRFIARDADEPEVRVHIFMYGGGPGEGMGEDPDDDARTFARSLEKWLNKLVSKK